MKALVIAKNKQQMHRTHPTPSRVPGWSICVSEISNNCWRVEAQDRFGRSISKTGADPDELVSKIEGEIEDDLELSGSVA